jgi:hypothetical protein
MRSTTGVSKKGNATEFPWSLSLFFFFDTQGIGYLDFFPPLAEPFAGSSLPPPN